MNEAEMVQLKWNRIIFWFHSFFRDTKLARNAFFKSLRSRLKFLPQGRLQMQNNPIKKRIQFNFNLDQYYTGWSRKILLKQ